MPSKLLPLLPLALVAAGCASGPEPDTTPAVPTAVLESTFSSDGIKGFVPMAGANKTFTRPDMRREDSTLKGTGTVTRFLVGNKEEGRIERLDRKLVWTLDVPEKTYVECPITGCPLPQGMKPTAPEPAKPADKPSAPPECTAKVTKSELKVTPTGQKSNINGFDTEQYQVSWIVAVSDPKARTTTSKVAIDMWTTAITPEMRDAVAMEEAYAKALTAELLAGKGGAGVAPVVPAEALRMMQTYLATILGSVDTSAFMKAGKEMDKIKGYPIRKTLTWDMKGDACADPKPQQAEEAESASIPTSGGDIISTITSYFIKKESKRTMQEMEGKPILSFTTEVKAFRVEPVRDSTFVVPKNFKQVKTK